MSSLELITQAISTLENFDGLDKVETKELLNFLCEIKKIPSVIVQIQLELAKRLETEAINSYIAVDDKLYSLETNTFYNVVTVNHANSMELIELQKEIDNSEKKLDDYID
jgi:ribosomal protein L7Ae-like RNA K-turn-binding protein